MLSYTVNSLNQAAWLVYINGLEVPVVNVSATFDVWGFSTVTLQMVPHKLLRRLGNEDRLQIAVFYLDLHYDPESPKFCLLAEYELIGVSYSNTPSGRFVQLNGIAQLGILEQLYFFYISSLDDIVSSCTELTGGDPALGTVVKTIYPASLFLEGLTAADDDIPVDGNPGDNFIKRPIDFVLNIFKALLRPVATDDSKDYTVPLGSEELSRSSTSVVGKNFFARWMETTRFNRKWVALPVMEDSGSAGCFPLLKAVQDTQVLQALQQQVGQSVGNAGTAWSLLQMVYGYMYMEIATLPAPPSVAVDKKTRIIQGPKSGGGSDTIATHFVKPQCTFALPPMCNVVFPSMLSMYGFAEDYRSQPTRLYLSEAYITSMLTQTAAASVSTIVQEAMSTGYPLPVKRRMQLLKYSPQSNNKNFLLFPEEFYKGPMTVRLNAPPWMYLLSQNTNANTNVENAINDALVSDTDTIEYDNPLGLIFDKYAEYEFYRARFASRSGSLGMTWNPYIVPGFPLMIFDNKGQSFDTMAYVTRVVHTFSSGASAQMSTNVTYSFSRTPEEFMGIDTPAASMSSSNTALSSTLEAAMESGTAGASQAAASQILAGLDIFPNEIIPDVSNAFQKVDVTTDLYRKLFYRADASKAATVFDWKTMTSLYNTEGEVVTPTYEQFQTNNYLTLSLNNEYANLAVSHDAAMHFISRPVCTLQDYIEIYHGVSLEDALREGKISGEYRSFYDPTSDQMKSRGAVFWGRIYKLIQGPGSNPGLEVTNIGDSPDFAPAGNDVIKFVGVATNMPQTRRDWDAILEEYRTIIRSESGIIFPQV